jgi:glutamine synthetase
LSEISAAGANLAETGIELDTSIAKTIASAANSMMATVAKISEGIAKEDFASEEEHMKFCAETIRPLMDEARVYADTLEAEVADELWPLPKYSEMLFIR